jgi:hypothetical protein
MGFAPKNFWWFGDHLKKLREISEVCDGKSENILKATLGNLLPQ